LSGFLLFKIKVGGSSDLERVKAVLDAGVDDLTLDANQGLSELSAGKLVDDIYRIVQGKRISFSAFEDPVYTPPGGQAHVAMARFARSLRVPVMADEPLSGTSSCSDFARESDVRIWNLRIGKCGGITGTILAAATAKSRGIGVVLGALVGEGLPMVRAAQLLRGIIQPLWVDAAFSNWILRRGYYSSKFRWPVKHAGYGLGVGLCEATMRRNLLSYSVIRSMAVEKSSEETPQDSRTLRAPAGPNGSPGIMTMRDFSKAQEANS
jgi:L-alanine-DL-glutamate epimerase-like enolase superfamily enzyme